MAKNCIKALLGIKRQYQPRNQANGTHKQLLSYQQKQCSATQVDLA